jgi:hypothetical protein
MIRAMAVPTFAHAVGHARRDAHQAGSPVAQDEAHPHAFGRAALPNVEQDEQHPIGRRHVPDIRLRHVQVEGLDGPRGQLAEVHLAHGEADRARPAAVGEPAQLGQAAAVVGVAG